MILITRIIGWEWGWSNKETKKKKKTCYISIWVNTIYSKSTNALLMNKEEEEEEEEVE